MKIRLSMSAVDSAGSDSLPVDPSNIHGIIDLCRTAVVYLVARKIYHGDNIDVEVDTDAKTFSIVGR